MKNLFNKQDEKIADLILENKRLNAELRTTKDRIQVLESLKMTFGSETDLKRVELALQQTVARFLRSEMGRY